MVDIARCERCGRVIPVLERGCPVCEEPDRGLQEEPYLPLAIRLLCWLFVAHALAVAVLALATALRIRGEGPADVPMLLLTLSRLLLALSAAVAVATRRRWARAPAWLLLGFESVMAILVLVGVVDATRWAGGLFPSLWGTLFVLLFLRQDLREWLDPRVGDSRELDRLLRGVERGRGSR